MHRHPRVAHAALALAVVVALAACGAPAQPTEQGFREVRAVVSTAGAEPVLAASLLVLDGAVINPSAFAEVFEGVWLAGVAPVGDDGTVTIDLPDGAVVPASLLAPAADLLDPHWFNVACELDVSDVDASLTPVTILELISFPGISAVTASGAALTIVTAQPFDLGEDDIEAADFVTFAYSDAVTTITTPTGGCSESGTDVFVDVALTAGWNQVSWRFTLERDPVTDAVIGFEAVHLGNDDTSPIHVSVLPFFLGEEFGGAQTLGLGATPKR